MGDVLNLILKFYFLFFQIEENVESRMSLGSG